MAYIPVYILVMFFTIVVDYAAAIIISKVSGRKRKIFLIISIISNCLILFTFKYFNFFGANLNYLAKAIHWNYSIPLLELALPIGLSFHIFQSLSYVIEVYRNNQKVEYNFGIYSLYVMFYPQLMSGPIERPQNLLHQFYEKHEFDSDRIISGLKLMLWGYFKKVAIADRLAIFISQVYASPTDHTGIPLIIATLFISVQGYCDFSGYSDIAVGIARVLGFKLTNNFNLPYLSKSPSEFWRRWHISLSTWFRDYLYFPLGGSRVSPIRTNFNLITVFAVVGLWHGAQWTFVVWGFLHGLLVVIDRYIRPYREKAELVFRRYKSGIYFSILQILTTFIIIAFITIFIRANTISDALYIILNQFNFTKYNLPPTIDPTYIFISFGLILILLIYEILKENKIDMGIILRKHGWMDFAACSFAIWLIILFGQFNGQIFLYFVF